MGSTKFSPNILAIIGLNESREEYIQLDRQIVSKLLILMLWLLLYVTCLEDGEIYLYFEKYWFPWVLLDAGQLQNGTKNESE